MASERLTPSPTANVSTRAVVSGGSRNPIIGVVPVAGRPLLFFCLSDIDGISFLV
jgi:hypothetical protein